MQPRPPMMADFLQPDWPAPECVRALCSTRSGGVSQESSAGAYASLNLGDHVGDDAAAVAVNRQIFAQALGGAHPVFLQQVHGIDCLNLEASTAHGSVADACTTQQPDLACTIMVADCLPVLFCNQAGTQVAAAHAGWRGLAGGVLESTLAQFLWQKSGFQAEKTAQAAIKNEVASGLPLMAWLGPCIGAAAFEVGAEVRAAFLARHSWSAVHFQAAALEGKFFCDLAGIARGILQRVGVVVYGNDSSAAWCTYSQSERWFSHRRESQQGRQAGRLAAAVWLDESR